MLKYIQLLVGSDLQRASAHAVMYGCKLDVFLKIAEDVFLITEDEIKKSAVKDEDELTTKLNEG